MSALPKISVIIPVFNAEMSIHRAIQSILDQTFRDFELLIIDNGSTDNTGNIIQSFTDPRIRHWRLEKPDHVEAMNFGLMKSRADFIARMDSDDYSFPTRLDTHYDFLLNNPDIGLVAGLVEYDGDEEANEGYLYYITWVNQIRTPEEIFNNRFRESTLPHPTVMFRKSLVKRHGEYYHGPFPEDFELYLRWMQAGVKMGKTNQVVLKWSDPPNRLTRSHSNYNQKAFASIKAKYFTEWYQHEFEDWKNKPLLIWGNSKIVKRKTQFLIDEGLLITKFIDVKSDPKKNIIHHDEITKFDNPFILNYVSDRHGKQKVEQHLLDLGFLPGKNFYMME